MCMICDTARRRQEVAQKLRLEPAAQRFLPESAGSTSKLAGPPKAGVQVERACPAVS